MTVEKYYTPNGQDINGNGITPDIIVEDPADDKGSGKTPESAGDGTDQVLEKALEVLAEDLNAE